MKITVDSELCSGHGRCYSIAPDVFVADSDGFNAQMDTVIEVPGELEDTARLGLRSCPEGAITELTD